MTPNIGKDHRGCSMATQTKQRTLQYRRATYLNKAGDLQTLMAAALKKLDDVKFREELLVEGGTSYRVISHPFKRQGMLTGLFLQYTQGQRQSLLARDAATKDYALSTMAAPNENGQLKEFVESILYFAVKNNHVMLVGSVALGAKAFENHLSWLLNISDQLKNDENGVFLSNQPNKDAVAKLTKFPIKSIELGSRLNFESKPLEKSNIVKTNEIEPMGPAAQALNAFLGKWFGGQKLTEALKEENVKVTVTVKYVSHTKSEEGFELMEQLAVAGRHFDEDDCVIKLVGGGTVKGKELKISAPITVNINEEELIVEADLWAEMSSWLTTKIKDGLIPAS